MVLTTLFYIEDKYCLTIGLNGAFKVKSVESIFIFNSKLHLISLRSQLNKSQQNQIKFLNSFKTILKNMIYNTQYGIVDYLYLKGIGFRALQNNNTLFFKLNYSHYIYYVLPLEMKVNIKKKNKLLKFQFFQDRLARNVLNKLHKFRVTNVYTQKGIFKKSQLIYKKEGKKKQI